MHETDETIVQAEMSLAKTKKQLDAHEAPLRTLDTQFAMQSKSAQQGSRDIVQEDLEVHLDSVKKNVSALATKWENTKQVVDQLRFAKQRLLEDYRYKSAALKIDDACMKVTPRKAIELDRNDPRGGRCISRQTPRQAKRHPDAHDNSVPIF